MFLLLLAGCGKAGNPDLVPIDVKVIYQGQPVDEAVVIFIGQDGKYANGLTNSRGIAEMATYEPGDGVYPGEYQVGIDKSTLNEESDPNDPTGDRILKSEAIFHIPAKYGDHTRSGLTANITREGPSEITFDLEE